MFKQTRRDFLITLFSLPAFCFLSSFLPNLSDREDIDDFVEVDGWILKRTDLSDGGNP